MKTTIPRKRTVQQRKQRDRDSESENEEGKKEDNPMAGNDYDSEVEEPADVSKRQNVGPTSESLQSSIAASIEASKSLPIARHRNQIISKLDKSRVLIISGDTGCGKTTQVPKFLLESGISRNQDVKIICTQPRRLAAVNIAKRVAQELGERVGETVGYHVGM